MTHDASLSPRPSEPRAVGRGAQIDPPNRFESLRREGDLEQRDFDEDLLAERRVIRTEFFADVSKTVISENDSPDVGFRFAINPYRGCEHGCAYCYARPYHEYLGWNAGLDFETKILVKLDAPNLLRQELNQPSWRGDPIHMSGVTDCYQPAEREFRLTRACLEVMLEARQPGGVITKNALVTRDLDVLSKMAEQNLAQVFVSVTTLDAELARRMEPRTATPVARLKAIRELSAAGVPTSVMVAPIIPGLNDHEIPRILEAAREAGARWAGFTMLRLPLAVLTVFEDWLNRSLPRHRDRVLGHIRGVRGGKLNDAQFGRRMRGEGPYAEQVAQTFRVMRKKFGLDQALPALDSSQFQPPRLLTGQQRLF